MNKPVKLLWTGGWDSTFRLCDLLVNKNACVEPYYLIDSNRKSLRNEIKAQETIKRLIFEKFPETSKLLLETKFFLVSEIPPNQRISDAFEELVNDSTLGTQYKWLALFCQQYKIYDLELGLEKEPTHPDDIYLRKRMKSTENQIGEYFIIDNDNSEGFCQQIFGYYQFPIFDTAREEMAEIARNSGFWEVMLETWFCHCPLNDKACGLCNPCKDVIFYKQTYRLPLMAKIRYRMRFLDPRYVRMKILLE